MEPHILEELSKLTVKEVLARVRGTLKISSALRNNKSALLEFVVANAPTEETAFLLQLVQDKQIEKEGRCEVAGAERKRKRKEQQNARRAMQRLDDSDEDEDDSPDSGTQFLQLPTDTQVKDCYRAFYDATSNGALATAVCGICARLLNIITEKLTSYPINSLPNVHHLVPRTAHPSHTLYDGKLLEEKGVKHEGNNVAVITCKDCFSDLQKPANNPPKYSLVNNMWIGKVPWQLQILTFPEQLLIALLYPRVYVFKLYPKKIGGSRDASTLQRGMRGNVSSYELNMDGISSMLHGNLMPRPPAVLASVISVTFIGLGDLPKRWLRTTFRVRCHSVFEALRWLKANNAKYYGDIEIDPSRIQQLPEDDVPLEVLGVVRQSSDTGLVDQENDGYVPVDDSDDTSKCRKCIQSLF